MRMISASSSVPRPLVGKEPARGGEEVRLPDQGCRNPGCPLVTLRSSCLALLLTKWQLFRRETAQSLETRLMD